ncbi:MAG: hypothetical protein K8W52_09180 [Deltaproteobacteria bacterium]|nr:hypothetical protein [Deltaproteobacteria bacterium]
MFTTASRSLTLLVAGLVASGCAVDTGRGESFLVNRVVADDGAPLPPSGLLSFVAGGLGATEARHAHLTINGLPAADAGSLVDIVVPIDGGGGVSMRVTAGAYTIALTDDTGAALTPDVPVEVVAREETGLGIVDAGTGLALHGFTTGREVANSGDTAIARVLNVSEDGRPVDVVQCAVDGTACVTVRAALPYGELWSAALPLSPASAIGARFAGQAPAVERLECHGILVMLRGAGASGFSSWGGPAGADCPDASPL